MDPFVSRVRCAKTAAKVGFYRQAAPTGVATFLFGLSPVRAACL